MANNLSAAKADPQRPSLKPLYLEAVSRVERLHRRLLDLIKDEFDRMGWDDINPVQALLMFNIGDSELTAAARTSGSACGCGLCFAGTGLSSISILGTASLMTRLPSTGYCRYSRGPSPAHGTRSRAPRPKCR